MIGCFYCRPQCCQMVYFHTKFDILLKILVFVRSFGITYGYMLYFVVIWYIFHHFDMMYQGNTYVNPGGPNSFFRRNKGMYVVPM
jgi:hypothetical protein